MHTFQPYPIDLLELNPFTRIGKDWALVTSGNAEKINAMTVSWGGVGVLWGKNVCFIFIRENRYTKEFIDQEDTFSLTFFSKEFGHNALKYMGAVSGRDEDKIKAAHLHVNYHRDIPFIDEGNSVILCKKLSATELTKDQFLDADIDSKWYPDGNYHTMYVGEILEVLAR